jgi:uncharacterized membrane protein
VLPQSPEIHLSITPETQTVKPGQQAAFVVAVENTSREAQAQSIELSGLPDAWYQIEFDTRSRAFPGERRVANIVISAPASANGGTYEFTVAVLAGASESSVKASVEVPSAAPEPTFIEPAPEPEPEAVAVGALEPEPSLEAMDAPEVTGAPAFAEAHAVAEPSPVVEAPAPQPVYVAPRVSLEGGLIIWRGQGQAPERKLLTIRNPGDEETDYVLEVQGLDAPWYSLLASARVGAGQELRTDLTIHPPEGARQQDYPFRIAVRVDGHPDLRGEASGWLSLPSSSAAPVAAPVPTTAPGPVEPVAPSPSTPAADRPAPPDVAISPRQAFRFDAGEAVAQALVTVTNRSRVRERYRIVISGIPEDWYRLSDTDVRLDPAENKQVSLRLSPVTGPGLPAGEYEFLVRAGPDGMPEYYGEALGVLSIVGAAKFDARLEPLQAEGSSRNFTVKVLNTGDMPLSIVLEPSDPEGRCKFKIPAARPLDPGQEGHIQLKVSAKRNSFVGPRETFDFRVHVINETGEAQSAHDRFDGRFVHKPKIPWRAVFLAGFFAAVAGVIFLLVWLASPAFEDAANWVGCQLDDDYRLSADVAPVKKEICGGRTRDEELDDWQKRNESTLPPVNDEITRVLEWLRGAAENAAVVGRPV